MPTRFWLVDAELRDAVSRLEAAGGVRRAEAAVDAVALADAHARHAAERDRALPEGHSGPRPSGGVGGTRTGRQVPARPSGLVPRGRGRPRGSLDGRRSSGSTCRTSWSSGSRGW